MSSTHRGEEQIAALEQTLAAYQMLAEASAALESQTDIKAALVTALRCLPQPGAVYQVSTAGELRLTATTFPDSGTPDDGQARRMALEAGCTQQSDTRIVAPLIAGGQLLGALEIERRAASHDSALHDRAQVEQLARCYAMRLERARLSATVERQAAEMRTIQRLAHTINSELRLETLFSDIVRQISAAFGYQMVSVYLRERDGLALQAAVGYDHVMEFIRLDEAVAGRVARTGQAAFVRDTAQDDDFIEIIPGTQQAIIVPLKGTDGGVFGTLLIESLSADLTDADMALLLLVADQVGIAITNARLLAEREASEARFRTLIQDLRVGVMVQGPQAEILITNPAACELLGLSEDQMRGVSSFDPRWHVIHEDGTPFPGETHPVPTAIATRRPVHNVVMGVARPARGDLAWLLVNAEPQLAPDGAVARVICTFLEITERKRMEEALRASEARYRGLMEQAGDAIFLATLDGQLIEVNEQSCALLGYSHEELLRCTVEDLVAPPDLLALALSPEQIRDSTVVIIDLPLRRKDGSLVLVEGRLRAIDGGRAALAIVRDLTERKRAEDDRLALERRLLESQKLESMGVLAGGIAHDFNNLLTVITGHVGLLQQDMAGGSAYAGAIREIAGAAQRAADLTAQMLAFSGRGRFLVQRCELRSLVGAIEGLLHAAVPRTIELTIRLPLHAAFEGDLRQIQQAVLNLVLNAVEAIGDQAGEISIVGELRRMGAADLAPLLGGHDLLGGTYLALSVIDTGHGMDAETQARMFDPFFSTRFVGRGLGLAAVQGIVRGHQGAIQVRSAVGRGTTITMLLPAAADLQPAAAGASAMAAPAQPYESGVVLVIDDEEGVRTIAARVLERLGLTVLKANDGQAGIELFRAHGEHVRAALIDLTMPRMGGVETMRELRRLRPGLPVLLMSGYSAAEVLRACAGAEPDGFVQKPFTPRDLTAAFQHALALIE